MNDQEIENEIQAKGLTAPRITPEDIECNIIGTYYFTADEPFASPFLGNHYDVLRTMTFCILVLQNGFTVTGEAACVSPENFNAELGRKIARQNAVQQIGPLMAYHLKQTLHAYRNVKVES